jgi:hypothetical protein
MYVINLDLQEHEFDNLTADWYLEEKDVSKNDDFAEWINYNKEELNNIEDIDEMFKKFVESEEDDIYEKYCPVVNSQHVLQWEPDKEQIELIARLCPNVTIIYAPVVDVHLLTLSACGMDFSDELELAYWIIDGNSPIRAEWFRDKEREELIKWYRKNNQINFSEIKEKAREILEGENGGNK